MFEVIKQSETVASRRRIYFSLILASDHFSAADIAVAGVKARLSKNGAASVASTADISKVDAANMPGEYYVELTAAEVDTIGVIGGYLKPATCDVSVFQSTVVSYDPYADGITSAAIAAAVLAAATTTPIASDVKKVNNVIILGDGGTTPFGP